MFSADRRRLSLRGGGGGGGGSSSGGGRVSGRGGDEGERRAPLSASPSPSDEDERACDADEAPRRRRRRRALFAGSHSLSSFAILEAMFLNPILVPDILLNLTPFSDNRGSLQTSISH